MAWVVIGQQVGQRLMPHGEWELVVVSVCVDRVGTHQKP